MFPTFFDRKQKTYYTKHDNGFIAGSKNAPIEEGILRFVESGSYASLFGDQWKEYKKTQLDSYSGIPISENRLNRCLGELRDKLQGKSVLEAGCGAGRFTEVLLKKGAQLVSADLSSAVEVNQENFPQDENHLVIQADINDMPFADESFDVVVCLGVIQHTPDPDKTIEHLYQLVKKGGMLVIDHYTFNASYWLRLATFYRKKFRKLSSEQTLPATKKLVEKYLPLHKKAKGKKLFSMILNRISPVISYYDFLPQLNDQQQKEWAMLDTHDSLTDWHKNFRNKKEITTTLQKLGATDIWCEYGGNGVEANCKKP